MKNRNYDSTDSSRLIEEFIDVLVKQEKVAAEDKIALYNRYFAIKNAIVNELKSRPGDERRLLVPLLTHNSYAVRYFAAVATLTIAPQEAIQTLEVLAYSLQYPYGYNAISTLNSLKSGVFVPS